MKHEIIDIWEGIEQFTDNDNKDEIRPALATYILEGTSELNADKKRASVLICPGGGYAYTSDREAEPVAMRFLAAGFNAFILRYRTVRQDTQTLLDLSRLWIIRKMRGQMEFDLRKSLYADFQPGTFSCQFRCILNELYISEVIGMPEGINKPNGLILGYPVITSGKYAHRGSFSNLLGRDATAEQKEGMSLELHVKNQVPPTFLWHTFHDLAVPVENSLLFAQALRQSGIPFELHIFPDGPHGLSLCDEETAVNNPDLINPHAANWMPLH